MRRKKVYVHYGASKFDRNHPLGGGHMGKPDGFWASPKYTDWGWKNFCESANFHPERLDKCIKFRLKKGAKILNVRSVKDIEPYLIKTEYYERYNSPFDLTLGMELDIEKLHADFDGMEVFMSRNWNLHDTCMFYQYDVDSIVIWNLDVINLNIKGKVG